MGRYSAVGNHVTPQQNPQQQQAPLNWPTDFPKPIIGIERDGVILQRKPVVSSAADIEVIPEALDAIRTMRLKGYKVLIITQQDAISRGILSTHQVDEVHNNLMEIFGRAGIMTIDGLYYSTSSMKEDMFAKPNTGMFDRAENEGGGRIKFREGWYVGDRMYDLKVAEKIKAKPILVRTGDGKEVEEQLSKFTYKDLKRKTKVFDNLLDFANSLA